MNQNGMRKRFTTQDSKYWLGEIRESRYWLSFTPYIEKIKLNKRV